MELQVAKNVVQETKLNNVLSTSLATPRSECSAAADTACTGHFISTNDRNAVLDVTETANGISIQLPNGQWLQSTHTAMLDLPKLPLAARHAHLFPGLTVGSLISIGVLCDHGMEARFTQGNVEIHQDGEVVLRGHRDELTRLWHIDLQNPPRDEPHFAANVMHIASQAQLMNFYH